MKEFYKELEKKKASMILQVKIYRRKLLCQIM